MSDCKAVLAIDDAVYGCDVPQPHAGISHRNLDAGRELDGRTWDEYPQAVTAQ